MHLRSQVIERIMRLPAPATRDLVVERVGGIERDIGEADVIQRAGAERIELFVEVRADPGDLALRYAGVRAEGFDQVVDRAGGDAVDVCLHDDRVEGLVDPAPCSSRLGKKLPARSFGIASSRSPASVVTVFSRCPLRQVVRLSVLSPRSAPIRAVASASISSCSSRSATSRTSSRPSAERSDSSKRSRSCRDKATGHPLGPNWQFTKDSCTVACPVLRERSPAVDAREGTETAHFPASPRAPTRAVRNPPAPTLSAPIRPQVDSNPALAIWLTLSLSEDLND